MQSKIVNPIIQWWHGESLPAIYIFPPPENLPNDFFALIRLYFRTWFVHPFKRRVAKFYVLILQTFFGLKVIAITGSAGKTSAKDMLYSILSSQGKTVASYLNIDPTFNIPTTILRCNFSTKYLILEMGVEYKGDMKFYRWLVTPDIALITNVFQTHTLFFGDEKGVAIEKRGILENLPRSSVVVLNRENARLKDLAEKTQAKIVWFGKGGEVSALGPTPSLEGTEFLLVIDGEEEKVRIPLIGRHFVENALAAATVAYVLDILIVYIKCGLQEVIPTDHRLTVKKLKNGAIILDDTYNNNPSAARATFQTVKEIKGNKKLILVYGDMKELGDTEVQRHKEIGKVIDELGAAHVILVGPLSQYTQESLKKTKSTLVENAGQVLPILKPLVTRDSLILIKGARSLKLESVIAGLV